MSDYVDKSEAWAVLTANTEKHLEFMRELSDALIKIRPLGGSELFTKRFGKFFADPKYCGAAIEQAHKDRHEAMSENIRLRRRVAALEKVIEEELYDGECQDEANQMLVDEIHERALG
jgi:hypothetical protein